MNGLITAFRVAILLFSLLGYAHAAARRLRPEFAIGTVFVCIGSIMFLAGILNILRETAWAVCLAGDGLALRALWKKEPFRSLLCAGNIFFLFIAVALAYILYGSKFFFLDNFSHWARIPQILLHENRLPNFLNANLIHQSYPTGSGSFIYYMLTIAGVDAEWVQMYAQATLSVSLTIGLFAFTDRPELKALTAAAAATLFCSNIAFIDLLVDNLLPMIGLGGMCLCLFYRRELPDKLPWTVPYCVFLLSVKSSGIYFVLVILIYAFVCLPKDRRSILTWLFCALCTAFVMLLWQKHVSLVFANGLHSRHAVSFSNFASIFGARTAQEIHTILAHFFRQVFSLSNSAIFLLILQLLAHLFVRFVLKRPAKTLGGATWLILLSYVGYVLGLLGMYLFNMPGQDAAYLSGYPRYMSTGVTFIGGLMWIELLSLADAALSSARERSIFAGFCTVSLALIYLSIGSPILRQFHRQDLSDPDNTALQTRLAFEQLIDEQAIPSGYSYIILRQSNDGFCQYLTDYLLYSTNSAEYAVAELAADNSRLQGFDYLIALDDTEDIRAYMESTFGDAALRVVPLENAP